MKLKVFVVQFLLGLLFISASSAASIGDPAPPVFVERWVKGAPVRVGAGTNIFVVEFWATWCGPCKQSIPHLTELQKKYADKGVIFVGFSDEKVETVQPFVAAQGGNMDYRVVVDSSKRTFNNWMKAYGESGIPHAFVVGTNGQVLWHDHPMSGLDQTLERITQGTFNLERAKNFEAGERAVKQYTLQVSRANAAEKAAPVGEKILTEYSQDWRIPNRLARAILTDATVRSRDLPLALRAATLSTEMTKRRASDALEMLARAQYATGKKNEALATAQEALTVCRDASDREGIEKLIAMYQKAGATASRP
ncbi:MAG TPA: TlpA disulfide reductase family protein [Verrucomicrobiae bacterium]|nr:TlpA disulfide reductase family protein [Verrucomicrobiae bacterium]